MSSCFTPRFGEALDSLRKDGYFNGTTPLEELLSPLDWRLLEVFMYRNRLDEGDRKSAEEGFKRIRILFARYGISDKTTQAVILRRLGLGVAEIKQALHIGGGWYQSHVRPLLNSPRRFASDETPKAIALRLAEYLEEKRGKD